MVEIGEPINKILNLNETEPFDGNFDALGYESTYFLNNMGTFMLDYVIYFAFITICYITRAWELTNSKLINMVYKSIMSFVMYNGIITLIIESYTDIWICSLI